MDPKLGIAQSQDNHARSTPHPSLTSFSYFPTKWKFIALGLAIAASSDIQRVDNEKGCFTFLVLSLIEIGFWKVSETMFRSGFAVYFREFSDFV